ncbi:hypothetical protein PHMEG_00027897 [Phytophthora megakarya]|uniref:Retrotransposon gag domain-containing protein n=1 Tax=Phytophthora megakarya TaxID=4795 RepID=A0A225V5V2_9STRA|nr:hypothetical protein PHMEG_00027897 [Phytophthora megakarya]
MRKKMKAPDDEKGEYHHGSGRSEEDLKSMYHRKELRDFVDQDPVIRILKLKRIADPKEPHQGSQDVEMESIRSSDHGSRWEYDLDDVDFPTSARANVATAATGSTSSTMIQRVRISAISDLKEFTKTKIERERRSARAWISKVKSAFMRDQASDDEKCLTFADLLAGSAKNWYHQLSRFTRNKWSDLLRSFQIQYCGLGVSVARQYHHTRRRSDGSPLDYLYRLNVAGLRVRLKIKDGSANVRREHVNHYIETLEDQDLAEGLTLLRLTDADDLEEVLRARDRAKNRNKGRVRIQQKPTNSTPSAPAKQVRAIQIQADDSGSDSESDGSGGSDSDIDSHRRIFLAASEDATLKVEKESANLDPRLPDRDHGHQDHNSKIHGNGFNRNRCSHCGSRTYSDKVKIVNVGQYLRIQAGGSVELPLRLRSSIHDKLWITRGDRWVPTISDGPGRTKYISITNIGDEVLILHQDQRIEI